MTPVKFSVFSLSFSIMASLPLLRYVACLLRRFGMLQPALCRDVGDCGEMSCDGCDKKLVATVAENVVATVAVATVAENGSATIMVNRMYVGRQICGE